MHVLIEGHGLTGVLLLTVGWWQLIVVEEEFTIPDPAIWNSPACMCVNTQAQQVSATQDFRPTSALKVMSCLLKVFIHDTGDSSHTVVSSLTEIL